MNASAFVLSAAASIHAPLAAKPFLCGRTPLRSPRLPPSAARLFPRFVSCTQAPEQGQRKEELPSDADPESATESSPVTEPVAQPVAEQIQPESSDPVAESTNSVTEVPQSVADDTDPIAETGEQESELEVEKSAQPVEAAAEGAQAGKTERKRRRRSRAKREITLPWENMEIGMELEGTVKSVTEYGAFIGDMGTPTDGLLHVSQLASGFVEKVSDVVSIGQKVNVRVLTMDVEKGNFSLTMRTAEDLNDSAKSRGGEMGQKKANKGMKRAEQNKKWSEFKYDPQVFVDARVTSITDFGGFCELMKEDGEVDEKAPTEGLIHISEMKKGRVSSVSDVLKVGEMIKVRIVATDRKRNRISMSLIPYEEKTQSEESGGENLAKEIEAANADQPEFKTSFELAFERAKAWK